MSRVSKVFYSMGICCTIFLMMSRWGIVSGGQAVRSFSLVLFIVSLMLSPSAQASSFSDMLQSLAQKFEQNSEGEDLDHKPAHSAVTKPTMAERAPVSEQQTQWGNAINQVSSEALLEADGNFHVVEQGREYDPAQAHLNARKKVNIARRKPKKELSPHFEPNAKSGQDGKLRVLQIEAQDNIDYDYSNMGTGDSGAGTSFLQKVFSISPVDSASSSLARADDVMPLEDHSIIVPKVKPNRDVAVSIGQLNTSLIMLVRYDSKVRMIDGITIPPVLPARRRAQYAETSAPSLSSDVLNVDVEIQENSVVVNDVAIPAIKPLRAVSLSEKIIFSEADHLIPVPMVKPNRARVALAHGSVSQKKIFVKNLRSGMHPDKTRVVIEVTDVTEYKVMVDGLRNVLRVKLSNAQWDISTQDTLKGSTLLGTYIARAYKDGSVLLEIRLKKKAEIVGTMVLRPNLSSRHRIVIDLRAL